MKAWQLDGKYGAAKQYRQMRNGYKNIQFKRSLRLITIFCVATLSGWVYYVLLQAFFLAVVWCRSISPKPKHFCGFQDDNQNNESASYVKQKKKPLLNYLNLTKFIFRTFNSIFRSPILFSRYLRKSCYGNIGSFVLALKCDIFCQLIRNDRNTMGDDCVLIVILWGRLV